MAFSTSYSWLTGTDQELLEICRNAQARIMSEGEYLAADGTILKEVNLEALIKLEAYYQGRVDAAAGRGSTINYARRRRPA